MYPFVFHGRKIFKLILNNMREFSFLGSIIPPLHWDTEEIVAFSPKHSEIAWITGMNHDGPLLCLQCCNETVPTVTSADWGLVYQARLRFGIAYFTKPYRIHAFCQVKKSAKSPLIFSCSFTWWRMQAERQHVGWECARISTPEMLVRWAIIWGWSVFTQEPAEAETSKGSERN